MSVGPRIGKIVRRAGSQPRPRFENFRASKSRKKLQRGVEDLSQSLGRHALLESGLFRRAACYDPPVPPRHQITPLGAQDSPQSGAIGPQRHHLPADRPRGRVPREQLGVRARFRSKNIPPRRRRARAEISSPPAITPVHRSRSRTRSGYPRSRSESRHAGAARPPSPRSSATAARPCLLREATQPRARQVRSLSPIAAPYRARPLPPPVPVGGIPPPGGRDRSRRASRENISSVPSRA